MSNITSLVKGVFRKVLPAAIRDSAIVLEIKTRLLGHNVLYDTDYYANVVEGPAVRSAALISSSIVDEFKPKRIIDVGCGTGALLEALRDRGCDVFGLEYSDAGLKYCIARGLHVERFNLERDVFEGNRQGFDVAVSMEVAEHLPESTANGYIDLLTRLSPTIVFTAAPPGQSGTDHVNLQPPAYWIAKYRERGFEHLDELSRRWRVTWKAAGNVETWYHENLMIFGKCREL
jgi:SAM-dependent methyltransferase